MKTKLMSYTPTVPGRFNPYWSQAAWFVDAVNGNDHNDGSVGAPLKTFLEIVRRLDANPILQQATTITIVSRTLAVGDRIALIGINSVDFSATLTIRGTTFAAATQLSNGGVITAFSNRNHAVADGAQYLTINPGVAQDWTAFVGKMILRTSDNAISWVAKNIGAGQARVSPLALVAPGNFGFMTSADLKNAAGADAFTVIEPTLVQNPFFMEGGSVPLIVENLEFQDDPSFTGHTFFSNDENLPTFNNCKFNDGFFVAGASTPIFNNCCFTATLSLGATGLTTMLAGLIFGASGQGVVGESCQVDFDALFQGCDIQCSTRGFMTVGDVGVYDLVGAASAAVSAEEHSAVYLTGSAFSGSSGTLYGTGLAGFTLLVTKASLIEYDNAANIKAVGTTALANVSGVNQGALPVAFDTHGNSIILAA